jgi:murein DD-endopeptidase MepM/ murein hydrolase activator NlpD
MNDELEALLIEAKEWLSGLAEGQNRNAYDFNLPLCNPVVAARAGFVSYVQHGYDIGGRSLAYMNFANEIKIVHPDGSVAFYTHLMQGSAKVKE